MLRKNPTILEVHINEEELERYKKIYQKSVQVDFLKQAKFGLKEERNFTLKKITSAQWYFEDANEFDFKEIDDLEESLDEDDLNLLLPKKNFNSIFYKNNNINEEDLLHESECQQLEQNNLELGFQNLRRNKNNITFKEIVIQVKTVLQRQLGSILLASLILATLEFFNFLFKITKKLLKSKYTPTIFSYPIFTPITMLFNLIYSISSELNKYTMIYLGISGNNFFTSSYNSSRLFKRNLIQGLTTTSITRTILSFFCWGLPSFTGLVMKLCGFFADLDKVFILFFILVSLTRFMVEVLENTIDSIFICYIIDLDSDSCRNEEAHFVFQNIVK
ncbi:hypothetical protein HK099_007600 [Clydaea vesicula]|uniref:Protein PNS1 n=1 Tax=Clydaea vesicula TaxID=447962 RepID=A0AAD5U8F2_9FUNG|nr:hypothetical protein HK099_007600 [Clydaea vesicula]